jgi:GNAT superfamily N-acetyltransferase
MIRKATYDDIDVLLDFFKAMHQESPRFSRMQFSDKKMLQILIGLIDSDNGLLLVTEHDGDMVGMFCGMVSEHFFSEELVANDIALYLVPSARGHGLARPLINEYVEWASKRTKFINIGISTGIHLDRTAQLYESLGFQKCSIGFEVKPCVQA